VAERQVVFFACEDIEKQPPFDCNAALEGLNELKDADWRVADPGLSSDLAVIVDQTSQPSSKPAHLRFLRIRDDTPFKLSAARKLTPVEVAANEAITEFTWAVLWPDKYLGGINMPQAPALKKLDSYFGATNSQRTHIVNLLRPDVIKRLKEMRKYGKLRKLQVSIRMSELEKAAANSSLHGFGSIIAAGKAADALNVDVTFSVGRSGVESSLNDGTAQAAEELASVVDALESMNVTGYDKEGEKQEINLKQERLGGPVQIEASTSDAQLYRAIERTRQEIEKEIGSFSNAARGS
jgi:hypothetical protein